MVRFASFWAQKNADIAENRSHMVLGKARFIWKSFQVYPWSYVDQNDAKGQPEKVRQKNSNA